MTTRHMETLISDYERMAEHAQQEAANARSILEEGKYVHTEKFVEEWEHVVKLGDHDAAEFHQEAERLKQLSQS